MRTATVTIEGITPLQKSREYASHVPKNGNETAHTYEERTWKHRVHETKDGKVFIPAGAFKQTLVSGARYKGTQIPGQGKKTYTAKFQSAVIISSDMVLDATPDDMEGRWVFCTSNGKRGGPGPRVWKCFPTLAKWKGILEIQILDEIIDEDVLRIHLEEAGKYIGVGTWRPENGGEYGRFEVKKVVWS